MQKITEKLKKDKTLKWILLALLIAVFSIVRLKYTKMGNEERFLPVSSATLEVPKFSIYKEECCMYTVTFKSFQNVKLLQKELDKIMEQYEKIECGEKNYYYDSKHDITIESYGIEKGLFLNEFYFLFSKGKDTTNCPISNEKEMKKVATYTDDQNKNHTIYINCPTCFSLQKGNEGFVTIEKWLETHDNGLDDLIKELEQDVNTGKVKKQIYKDGGTILYQSKTIGLLKCNTLDGNQDIYIGDKDLTYENDYCK